MSPHLYGFIGYVHRPCSWVSSDSLLPQTPIEVVLRAHVLGRQKGPEDKDTVPAFTETSEKDKQVDVIVQCAWLSKINGAGH